MAGDIAVETRALRRTYVTRRVENVALDGIDLVVPRGELYGVLGPNGAGKTTLIKILVTLLAPTSGTARVDGLDVMRQYRELRPRIAMVSGGENSGFGILTVREQLWMFSQFYGLDGAAARRSIDDYLERLRLTDARDRLVMALSSGMRQKMNLIRGFITNPRVLFLDEPTVALDVGAARDVRREVRAWMREDPQRTVILTTHYMAEADELCDRIAIVNRGSIVSEGTPQQLKARVAKHATVELDVTTGEEILGSLRATAGVEGVALAAAQDRDRFDLVLADDSIVARVLGIVEAAGRHVISLRTREPSLEDAFVQLVGRGLTEEAPEGE